MKGFNRTLALVWLAALVLIGLANVCVLYGIRQESGRPYRVEISRAVREIEAEGLAQLTLSDYPSILRVERLEGQDAAAFFTGSGADCLIREINGSYYRFDYQSVSGDTVRRTLFWMNLMLAGMLLLITGVLLYLRRHVLRPFFRLREVPYELSKGNLTVALKEHKNRYFGRFVWGMDLLRERLEEQRAAELQLQKEKKTLVLSVSHDIKTPLSAIKLYAKALEKGLYADPERQFEITQRIGEKCNEIDAYVAQIIRASSEEFLNLQVAVGEFYLSAMLRAVETFYQDKLPMLKIGFQMGEYQDCLLKGDCDRGIEVLQNLVENAVKYGDGGQIRISVSNEEECRTVTVANTGCTLSAAELPHIFDSFWRGSNVGSQSGSGLGLYICRQLMRKMDGDCYASCGDGEMRVTVVFRMA